MKLFLFFLLLPCTAFSQEKSGWEVPLATSVFPQLRAADWEGRVGFIKDVNSRSLRLDIGSSFDLLHYYRRVDTLPTETRKPLQVTTIPIINSPVMMGMEFLDYREKYFTFGVDFITLTKIFANPGFIFPVDAVDYLFGVNMAYVWMEYGNMVAIRTRISHISAHVVDGHFNKEENNWRDGSSPFVYSREFLQATVLYRSALDEHSLTVYSGLEWLFHAVPSPRGSMNGHLGAEFATKIFSNSVVPFAALDFRNEGEIFNARAGVKFGAYEGRGLSLLLYYRSGASVHGEYFGTQEKQLGLGLYCDL